MHGTFQGKVEIDGNVLTINKKAIKLLSEAEPANLPWDDYNIDVVIESTGLFVTQKDAQQHIDAGAKKVIISAPAKGGDVKTIVLGVNDYELKSSDNIVSNASCTTNCIAPMIKVLQDNAGIERGTITTIHAYTSDQRLHDAPHKDLRRARAGAYSIIPTTTGAASAVGLVIPELNGKLDGMAMRVPVPDGSITDCSIILKKQVTAEQINTWMQIAAQKELKGILQYTEEPIVSVDLIGNPNSCIFDASLTKADGKLVKLIGWYDNEFGYSSRLVDLAERLFNKKRD